MAAEKGVACITFGGLLYGSADYVVGLVPVVRGGEGNGWLVGSDGAYACRVG